MTTIPVRSRTSLILSSLFIIAATNFSVVANARGTKAKSEASNKALTQVISEYRNSGMVKMAVKKTTKYAELETTKVEEGTIYISKGKLRWEAQGQEKSLIVFDGQDLWNVEYPPAEMKSPVQVIKTAFNSKSKNQAVLSLFVGKKPVTQNFKVEALPATGDLIKYKLEPKEASLSVKDLIVEIDAKKKIVKSLAYADDLKNETSLSFDQVTTTKSGDARLFQFSPPKGAEVTKY
jgi:outer membrane lipoprotein-sorting protein